MTEHTQTLPGQPFVDAFEQPSSDAFSTSGTAILHFEDVKNFLSDKPLRTGIAPPRDADLAHQALSEPGEWLTLPELKKRLGLGE